MRDDLVDTVIAPAGAEAASGLLSDARENTERVNKYLKRFREVQERRANMEVCFQETKNYVILPQFASSGSQRIIPMLNNLPHKSFRLIVYRQHLQTQKRKLPPHLSGTLTRHQRLGVL